MDRAGDVPLVSHHGSELQVTARAVQRTRSQEYVGNEWCPGRPHVKPYVHYRLVLKTLGTSLNQYKSTRQLCEVIRDAIVGKRNPPLCSCLKLIASIAHTAAYDKARILHRDVSVGNVLITDEGGGILIDWDLSKKVNEGADPKPRQHSRTVCC
jgi:serine/threonine protein kinase